MKKLVLSIVTLFFSLGINAQEYNSEKGHYSKVIQAEGQSIQEINQKVNEWIALNYKSAQDVIQLNSESKIVMKAIQSIPTQMYGMAYSFYVNNTVTISIREGRFKVDYELGNWTVPKNPKYTSHPTPNYWITKYDKEEYLNEMWIISNKYGGSKAGEKMMARISKKYGDGLYEQYLKDYTYFQTNILGYYIQLEEYVSQPSEEDDW